MDRFGHMLLTGLIWFIIFGIVIALFGRLIELLGRLPRRCPECRKLTMKESSVTEEPGYGTRFNYTCSRCGATKLDYVKHPPC